MNLEYFIPFYSDQKRLFFQLSMLEKYCSLPFKCIIYDSSPNPIGLEIIKNKYPGINLIYKALLNDSTENTFYPKLRDFALSDDYEHGAIIMPQDELVLINPAHFNDLDVSFLAASTSFWISPFENKIAEKTYCLEEGKFQGKSEQDFHYLPQYHGTYIRKDKLKLFGKFIKEFLSLYGIKNRVFCDLYWTKLMSYSEVFYSKKSYYFLEKLAKRKNSGTFTHYSIFLNSIFSDSTKKDRLLKLLLNSVESFGFSKKESITIIKSIISRTDRALIMPNFNASHHLFQIDIDIQRNLDQQNSTGISICSRNEFSLYHKIGAEATQSTLNYIFAPESQIGNDNNIEIIRLILMSYID